MPGCLPCRPSSSASTIRCPPIPSAVRGPGVQPSGVQPVQCPVIWLPRPGPAVPAVWCPARPASAVWCPSVRPIASISSPSASGGDGDTSVRRANRHDWNEASSMWSVPSPSGSVDGPSRPGCGQHCGGRVEASGGASAADLGRVVLGRGGWGRPIREARPPQGAPRGWRLRQAGGWQKRDVSAPTAWLPSCLKRDYSPWLSWSLTPE
jgi:hypothetical protein